jgi:tartrate/fumarate subfamily iron-sulfur-dependent hydro-lyase beta chain
MDAIRTLTSPFDEQQVRALKAGESVRLSGTIYTGRDRLHAFLHGGGETPVSLRDAAIYHCGPVVVPADGGGWRVVAAGPTTSSREEPYMAGIIARHGVRVILGKGGMGDKTREACRTHGCVYLQAVGGAAALLAKRVTAVRRVFFLDEFGATEAMWDWTVAELEAVVGIDTHGRSLFDEIRRSSESRLAELA